jgi:DNA-directed RNA polymerase beta' subunit
MDEVGIPAEMAWKMFRPWVVRGLVLNGYPATEALKAVKDRTSEAKGQLLKEMSTRPVVYNRAPALHRYNYTGAYAKLRDDYAIGLPYVALKGQGADNDGDAINIHVPVSKEAIEDVKNKLMLSKNLFHTSTFETHLEPMQDYLIGLYLATKPDLTKAVKTFNTVDEAKKAFARGEISARTPIRINK